jgi:hypothetical protein
MLGDCEHIAAVSIVFDPPAKKKTLANLERLAAEIKP